ncbi:quinone oxidoreductase family protein [Ktedonospora formicarum]|uniref:NADPH:quinone reductase n=1 Tax=Ktedonospora formicarum TaxID=2778364 RepID=A0A8J3I368_9CHLR|nr:zinc-binding dehydrogenase [Ktedonospora formicarum]GHO49292.1 NADPH:quinone reductase [Ktedonospora formicarum]
MKAVIIPAFGEPEVLKVQEFAEPQPGAGQVVIRVAYAGVNYAETMLRRGGHHQVSLPIVPGLEVAGYVHALGDGVEGLYVGQMVAAFTGMGGYAELVLAPAALTIPFDGVELATAAGFPTIVPTAYDMLVNLARIRKGESVLIHAAAGGVGTIAGQIARELGASQVIGTVGSERKIEYARAFGYDHVLIRDGYESAVRELTGGRGVDVVLESTGEPVRSQSLKLLAPFGRLVIFGSASGDLDNPLGIPREPGAFLAESKSIMGYSIGNLSQSAPELLSATFRQSLELVKSSRVRIDIADILPLEQVSEAHRRLESRDSTGKLILHVS